MRFVGAVFAGISVVVVATIAWAAYISVTVRNQYQGNGAVGWDPVSLVRPSVEELLFVAAAFAFGFCLRWRKG